MQGSLRLDEQIVEPHFHTALGLDGPFQLDRLALLRVNGQDFVVFTIVELDCLDVVKDREQMRLENEGSEEKVKRMAKLRNLLGK